MAETQIRRATLQDLEAILDLWQEMMDYHARLDQRFQPVAGCREHFRTTLRGWMADDSLCVLVAVADGEVVGYTIGRIAENPPIFNERLLGHVSDICVAAEWRRRGLGRRLFAALLKWFRRHGLSVVQLNVSTHNPVSQAFWRKMGFQQFTHRLWLDI